MGRSAVSRHGRADGRRGEVATIARMDLTAQVLHDVEFREAKRGGYNTQDVDEFLERLAVAVDRQDAQLREARQRVAAAESAHRGGRAPGRGRRAAAGGGQREADETLKRTLVLAQRTADAAIREAEERAARHAGRPPRTRPPACWPTPTTPPPRPTPRPRRRPAGPSTRPAPACWPSCRSSRAPRELLRSDVELLEHHIDEQRERLRLAIREPHRPRGGPRRAPRGARAARLAEVDVPQPEPEPDPSPRRSRCAAAAAGRRRGPTVEDEDEEPAWAEPDPEADDYEPVQLDTPPSRTGPRSGPRRARGGQRPLLAEARRAAGRGRGRGRGRRLPGRAPQGHDRRPAPRAAGGRRGRP